jgi:hypothetical protein
MKLIIFILLFVPIIGLAETGVYMNLAGGWSTHHGLPTTAEINATSSSQQDNFPIGRFGIGYLHDFNPSFGIGFEIGQGFYNKTVYHFSNGAKLTARSSIADFLGVLVWHLKKIDLLGKFGGNRHTINVTNIFNARDQTDIQPEMMLGANYIITPHFALSLIYLHAFRQHKPAIMSYNHRWTPPSLDALLAGFTITFF